MANELVATLKTIRSNFGVGLYAHCMVRRLTPERVAQADRVIIGEDGLYCIPRAAAIPGDAGSYYAVGFDGPAQFNIDRAAMEFSKMLVRNFTLDMFEATKKYSHDTGASKMLKAQDWFPFARMMRNSLTHTQRFSFNPHDKTLLPVSWRGKTIEASMDGTEPPFTFYDWWDACELWEEINAFATSLA